MDKAVKIGAKVRILIDPPPGGKVSEGVVRVIQEEPGKRIGVELDILTDYGHSLDGVVESKVDNVRGITIGKGWWTLEQNIEIL